jgi:predicted restriction endonuclease
VGIEAAHVRWHSQAGPDVVANGLALCALHHALFDLAIFGRGLLNVCVKFQAARGRRARVA